MLNMGPLGAWYNMQHATWPTLALTASATLVTGLNDILNPAFIAQVVNLVYIPTYDVAKAEVFDHSNVKANLSSLIWNDTRYSFGDKFQLAFWVIAALDGIDSDASIMLRDYFLLDYTKMTSILGQLVTYIDAI